MIKAVLSDFDGTIVTEDILDVICDIVGKKDVSRKINLEFQKGLKNGRESLVERINFLKGIRLSDIFDKLEKNSYLKIGVQEFIQFLKKHHIVIILHSGNIIPVLKYYQRLLDIDYIVGTHPKIEKDKILGISKDDFPIGNFKISEIENILEKLSIKPRETIALGNSISDIPIFNFAGKSIAVDPEEEIKKEADYIVFKDLKKIIPIIKQVNSYI